MVEVDIDISYLQRDLRRMYIDLNKDSIDRATYRALNHTILKMRTTATRYTRENLRLRSRDIRKQLIVKRASKTNLKASLGARSAPLRVKDFNHRQFRRGVKVGISPGKRKMINRAFIAKMPNGHRGVFARGRYVRGQGFKFETKSTPNKTGKITQLLTTTVPQKLDDRKLQSRLLRQAYNDIPKRMSHLLGRESDFGRSPIPV